MNERSISSASTIARGVELKSSYWLSKQLCFGLRCSNIVLRRIKSKIRFGEDLRLQVRDVKNLKFTKGLLRLIYIIYETKCLEV